MAFPARNLASWTLKPQYSTPLASNLSVAFRKRPSAAPQLLFKAASSAGIISQGSLMVLESRE